MKQFASEIGEEELELDALDMLDRSLRDIMNTVFKFELVFDW